MALAAGLALALGAIPVALLGLGALAPGCPAGAATPGFQPAGYECAAWVTTWDFAPPPPSAAIVVSDASDVSAPSPPSVLAIAVAPLGNAVRSATALPGGAVVAEEALGLHFGFSIKPAALWRDHPTDLSMGITLTSPDGARATLFVYALNQEGRLVPGLRLRDAAGVEESFVPDQPMEPVVANLWQHWQVGIRRAGEASRATIEWWVDGALIGRRDGLAAWGAPFTAATARWTIEASGLAASGTYARLDNAYVGVRPASDRLVLKGEPAFGDEETVVLFDARTAPAPAPCTNDGMLRGAGVFRFGNLLSSADCASVDEAGPRFADEIAVLSRHNAFLLVTDHSWTDEPGETLTRQLGGPLKVPVKVWIVAEAAPGDVAVEEMARRHLQDAIVLLDENRAGVTLEPILVEVVSGDAGAKQQIGTSCRSDRTPPPRFDPLYLNVYYVSGGDESAYGWSCPIAGVDGSYAVAMILIYVDMNPSSSTLAHELGHAFSLEHVGESGYDTSCYDPPETGFSNLMFAGGSPYRSLLTVGQVFRVNTGPTSLVNRLAGVRVGPTRDCPFACRDSDGACPRVTKQ